MQVNEFDEFDGEYEFFRKLFVLDTSDVGKNLGRTTRIYLLEMVEDQPGESFAARKAARSAAVKKFKATVEEEFQKRNPGKMTEGVPDERTFDEMFVQLKELMVKFQEEVPEADVDFLPIFDHEYEKVCVLVSNQLLRYQIKPKYKTFFKTPEELNRFVSHEFESAFFRALLAGIDTRIDDLITQDRLERELPRSKSSQDSSNDSDETDL